MVVQVAISLALGVLARALQPKQPSPIDADLPTPTSQRGSPLPLVLGRQRVAPVQAWFGKRYSQQEGTGKGKGSALGGSGVKVYYEEGWHQLCVGPASRLYRIRQGGKPIFVGAVDPVSTPSGATLSCGSEGSLRLFWGSADGPVNGPPDFPLAESLADPSRVGIASRWPLNCNVHWTRKRLGTSTQWQALDYELEVRAQPGYLSGSPGWLAPTLTPSGSRLSLVAVTNGLPGVAALVVAGDHTGEFQSGTVVRLLGSGADGDYAVSSSSYVYGTGTPGVDFVLVDRTTIVLSSVLVGATAAGQVEAYTQGDDDGVNPAHAIAQLLFAPYPYGCGLAQDAWHLPSLEYLGQLCASERLPANFTLRGQTYLSAVAALLLDLGVLVGQDAGLLRFKEVRAVDPSSVPLLVPDLTVRPLPQQRTSHDDALPTRVAYSYQDRSRNFRTLTLQLGDDGRAALARTVRARAVALSFATDRATASRCAERRYQTDPQAQAVLRVTGSRAARYLFPGQALRVAGVPGVQRVLSTKPDSSSGRVELETVRDSYGVPATTYQPPDAGGRSSAPRGVVPDLGSQLVEVPEYVFGAGTQVVLVPRIRGHDLVVGADLWLSGDGATYQHVARDLGTCTGGALVDALLATDATLLDQGPRVQALGPDWASVQDLSSDLLNWSLGRQVAVLTSGGQTEICYLRSVTAVAGGYWRLDGLLRARLDTQRLTHPAGTFVYIFRAEQLPAIEDLLLAPQTQVSAKTQPFTTESLPLEQAQASSLLLYGKGVRPMCPEALRTTNLSNSYRTSQAIDLAWQWRSSLTPKTGAGMQGAGAAVGSSAPDGTFTLYFTTTSDVLKREVAGLQTASYSYSNAQLVADFGGEPSALKVKVVAVRGGYLSDPREITVTRV